MKRVAQYFENPKILNGYLSNLDMYGMLTDELLKICRDNNYFGDLLIRIQARGLIYDLYAYYYDDENTFEYSEDTFEGESLIGLIAVISPNAAINMFVTMNNNIKMELKVNDTKSNKSKSK